MVSRTRIAGLAVLVTAALLAAGCSGASGSGGTGESAGGAGSTFTLGLTTDPGTISPYATTLGTARQVFAFGYDSLIYREPDGKVVSGLAAKWTSTADSVTYTLKAGITCSDGTLLTASDVAADFQYISNPQTLSPWLSLTVPVPFTVTADNSARTVTFKTTQPFGLLLYGAGSLPIVCPKDLKDPAALAHTFGGTGPYTVAAYVPGDEYILKARKDYNWGPNGATTQAKGEPQTVVIKFIPDETTAANLLLAGSLNAAQVTGPDVARLKALRTVAVPVIDGELDYNEAPGHPLSNELVRKALTMVLPQSQLVKVSTAGTGEAASNLIVETPVLCPGNIVNSAMPKGTAQQAASLLDQAGWHLGANGLRTKDGQTLTLKAVYFSGMPDLESTMELVAQVWKKLGVSLDLSAVTNAVFNEVINGTGAWDVEDAGLNVEQPFMVTPFYSGDKPPSGRNSGDVQDAQFEKLSAQAMALPGTSSCGTWNKAWQALIKDADVVPISVDSRTFFLKKGSSLEKSGLFAIPTSLRISS